MGRHVARKGERRKEYRVLVGKPEGKRPLGRPRRRGVDNIKIGLVWTRLIWFRIGTSWWTLVNMVMNFRVP
jgi:hypothetical protein